MHIGNSNLITIHVWGCFCLIVPLSQTDLLGSLSLNRRPLLTVLSLSIQTERQRASEGTTLHVFVHEWTDCPSGDFVLARS
jgi:hypothetical protein